MRLGRFPDPRQEKILVFLEEKCHGSGDPIDGLDAPELVDHLSVPQADLSELVSDLEERSYVRTGHADSLNPIGMITITAGSSSPSYMRRRTAAVERRLLEGS